MRCMSNLIEERVTGVRHWTDNLFSFTTTRDQSFRFRSGQFTMLGLPVDGRPLLRAYSIASAAYDDHLEFFSIKVPNGPLTSRLQHLREGDVILLGRKATGTLLLDNLLPGRTLYLLATGTGLAPFLSIIKDPDVYERFERVVLAHTCRRVDELAYRDFITATLPTNEYFGEDVRRKLIYYPTVTREAFPTRGRITDLIETGQFFADTGLSPLNAAADRVMLCGSPGMLADTVALLESRGFIEGNSGEPGSYVIEKAFVDKG
jgi:ferredoxin--NADP+ reductase